MKVDRHESKRKTGESACQELQAEKELKKRRGRHLQASHPPSFPPSVVRTTTVELGFTVYFRKWRRNCPTVLHHRPSRQADANTIAL